MGKKRYTTDQIEDAWKAYRDTWCFKYLKGGNTHIAKIKPETSQDAVSNLERVRYNQVMGFPKFLRMIHA
jgi:hypothetical protein